MGGKCEMKPGDTVQYVRAGAIEWELNDWAEVAGLRLGAKYTVDWVGQLSGTVTVKEDMTRYEIHQGHFEVVDDE